MKTTVKLNTGNFSIILTGEPNAEYLDKCIKNGLVYDLQRDAATKSYIAVAGVPGKKEGVLVLPEGFKRESVAFSMETAEKFKQAVLKQFGKSLNDLSVVVVEHEKEESSDGRTNAKIVLAKWDTDGKRAAKLAVLDYEGEVDNDDDVIEFIHKELVRPDK